ncbi:MAG: hypothetical protein JEZ11_01055 [Desulfobacterales bacterium]|nr:hypothetical protein [Desulfobacterales bacterium]
MTMPIWHRRKPRVADRGMFLLTVRIIPGLSSQNRLAFAIADVATGSDIVGIAVSDLPDERFCTTSAMAIRLYLLTMARKRVMMTLLA